MLGALTRIARASGNLSVASDAYDVGDASNTINLRRNGLDYMNDRQYPNEKTEAQLDSFRGVVYAATDKIARRVAQLGIRLFQCEHNAAENQIDKTELKFHPFLTLFSTANGHRPHEEYSVWELMYSLQISLDTTGEVWWLIERDDLGRPARITPLPSNRITIVFSKETGLTAGYFFIPKNKTLQDGGLFFPKPTWEQLHKDPTLPFVWYARYPGPRGIEDARGWSPIKAAAYAYDINLFEQIYKRNFLQQGAQLGGILQSEVALNKDQIEEYLDQFKNRHSGIGRAGLPMVLPKMLKWTTTEPTPRDIQWAEALNMTQSQILQIYGISDAKLGRADIGNRNTADAMDVTFNREVIQSRCDMLMAKLNTDFVPIYPLQTDELYFSVEFENPVPTDNAANLAREKQDLDTGVTTPNEIRKKRGDSEYGKFGDMVYKPLTHVAIDPMASDLTLAQDDADKLGFVDPAEVKEGDTPQGEDGNKEGDPKAEDKNKKQNGGSGANGKSEKSAQRLDINVSVGEMKPAPRERTVKTITFSKEKDDRGQPVSATVVEETTPEE